MTDAKNETHWLFEQFHHKQWNLLLVLSVVGAALSSTVAGLVGGSRATTVATILCIVTFGVASTGSLETVHQCRGQMDSAGHWKLVFGAIVVALTYFMVSVWWWHL